MVSVVKPSLRPHLHTRGQRAQMDLVVAAGQFREERAEREQVAECRGSVGQDRCHCSHLLGGCGVWRLTVLRVNGSVSAPLAPIDIGCQPYPTSRSKARDQ
jgi:hypothetical protein